MRIKFNNLMFNPIRVVAFIVTLVTSIKYMNLYKKDNSDKSNKAISLVSGAVSGLLLLSEINSDFHPEIEEVEDTEFVDD